MKIEPQHYFDAALERIEQARALYRRGDSYALSMYVAGVAVECMLRAYKARRDPTLDERHDLLLLFRASGLLEMQSTGTRKERVSESHAARYAAELQLAANEVYRLWANDYRYASEARVLAHLKRARLNLGTKGNLLKSNALYMFDAAHVLIDKGAVLWSP